VNACDGYHLPVSGRGTAFDRFAQWASDFASHATFFAACVLLVLVWAPSYFLFGSLDTWQLVINTATTIVTFILVALLQNTQRRSDDAMHAKLDALADGLADLMAHIDSQDRQLTQDIEDLRASIGGERPET
jgi:low affinity Fe/Cu permease